MQSSCYHALLLILSLTVRESISQCIKSDSVEALSRCSCLYGLLEDALLSNRDNLYALRQVFYPPSGHPSILLLAKYNITSDVELTNNSTAFEVTIKWSASSFFSVINPYVVYEFLSGFMLVFVKDKFKAENVLLNLNVSTGNSNCLNTTEKELKETLQIITNRLKAYAEKLDILRNWDGSGRGYIWEYHYLSSWFWLFLVGDILLTVFAIWLSHQIYLAWNSDEHNYIKNFRNKLFNLTGSKITKTNEATKNDKTTKNGKTTETEETTKNDETKTDDHETAKHNRYHRVLLFLRAALIIIPCIELVSNIIFVLEAITICLDKECQQEVIPIRVMINASTIAIGIVSGIIGVRTHKHREKSSSSGETPENDNAPLSKHASSSLPNRTDSTSASDHIDSSSSHDCDCVVPFISSFVIAYFFVFISINVIPTLIAGFIFPNEIVLAVVYFPMIAIILLIYAELSYHILIVPTQEKDPSKLKQPISCFIYLFHASNFMLVLFVTTELFVFTLFIYNTDLHPPAYITLLFPLVLSGFTIMKNKLKFIFEESEDSRQKDHKNEDC